MREAGLLLPRADKSPVEPRCIHHMLALLEGRLGRGIKARFWEDRLRWPRNTSQCRRRLCRCAKSNGAACAAPAMKGSLYYQALIQVELIATVCNRGFTAAAAR